MKSALFALVSTLMFFTIQGMISKEEIENFKAMHQKCCAESGLDPKAIIKNIDDEADNKEFKCFLKCMMVEKGGMDDLGELQLDNVKSLVSDLKPEIWEQAVDACKDLTDDDLCEKAFKLTKCVADEVKKTMS